MNDELLPEDLDLDLELFGPQPPADAVPEPSARAQAALAAIAAEPHRYGFYAAMRLIESTHPRQRRLGESAKASDDPVRLAQEPYLSFAPTELSAVEWSGAGGVPRLEQRGFGLFGPNGPLPLHLTEYARERRRNDNDPTLSRFLDIFHHRMTCLFYRAWANTQPTVQYERPPDRFAAYVAALIGMGQDSLRSRDALPDEARLHRAGRLALQSHPAGTLEDLLSDYFGVDVHLREFMGEWLSLPSDSHWRLGAAGEIGALGISATIGESVWGSQYKFRIVIGPLRFADFERFLPHAQSLERLTAFVRFYASDALNWDVQLVLLATEVPTLELGRQGQLGRTAWLAATEREHDAADAVLEPLALLRSRVAHDTTVGSDHHG